MTRTQKNTASTVTRGDKFGFLTVLAPRVRIVSGMPYHDCICACRNGNIFGVKDHSLRAMDRLSCGECEKYGKVPVHYCMPPYDRGEQSLIAFIARHGVKWVEGSVWRRNPHSWLPLPYTLCRDDRVLISGTKQVGRVIGIRPSGETEVLLFGETKSRMYALHYLILIERPGCEYRRKI